MEATTGWSLKGHNNTGFWYGWCSLTKNAKCESSEHQYCSIKVRRDAAAEPGLGSSARAHCPAAGPKPACTSACSCPQLQPAPSLLAAASLGQGTPGSLLVGVQCRPAPVPPAQPTQPMARDAFTPGLHRLGCPVKPHQTCCFIPARQKDNVTA